MKPIIAITAGDVAGVGPEVILRALTSTAVAESCIPVLIGHALVFRQAAEKFGINVPLQTQTL